MAAKKLRAVARETADDGEQNARAWLASIVEMVAALDAGDDCDQSRDDARQRIEESVLSVEVRSGWTVPGQKMELDQYRILLTCGGPTLELRGDLDRFNEPDDAGLFYRWASEEHRLFIDDDAARDALLTFARCFYFAV